MAQAKNNPASSGASMSGSAELAADSRLGPVWLSGWSLAIFALAACWLSLFNELRGEWEINPQYNYGYVVPLLGLALFWRRWPERPSVWRESSRRAAPLATGILLLLLPLRIIAEANPEWRLVFWVHALLVIGLTLCLLYAAGGSPWVAFFAPPVFFLLVCVPWPMGLERAVIQTLMRLVAGLTVELLGWLDIPALQQGNLIQVGVGTVGIDEACSGVRSLQSGLMLSLFLGEMHRFPFKRRLGLIGASFAVVLMANLARTTFLTWVAATRGLHAMESLHDAAGVLVMCIVLPALLALAHLMKPKTQRPPPTPPQTPAALGSMSRWAGIAAVAWLVSAEAATEFWYRSRENGLVSTPAWTVNWPAQNPRFTKTILPQNSLAILRCSDSESAAWQDEDGNQWSGFLLRWRPGKNSAQLAKGHRPDICFPAAGARLVEDLGPVSLESHGIQLPFRHQVFATGPHLFHVFYCLWPDRVSPHEITVLEDGSHLSRLMAVMAGKRNVGQKVMEIVVSGPESDEAAVTLLRLQLPNLINPSVASASMQPQRAGQLN